MYVCYGGHGKGSAWSKQSLSNWIVDTITHVYRLGLRVPPVKCHLDSSVSTSRATLKSVPLKDICAAGAWASSCTFARREKYQVACVTQVTCDINGVTSQPPAYACDIQILHTVFGSHTEFIQNLFYICTYCFVFL